jgi:hypothetical protein
MEILFGLLVIVLVVLGLRNRKKSKKAWVKEERYEESGDWIDKRSGERGTYGSLDNEMEANRQYIALQRKINESLLAVQALFFAQYPDFQKFSDEKIKQHLAFCKSEILGLFEQAQLRSRGKQVILKPVELPESELLKALKKTLLDASYEHFPQLLDLEIEQIKQYDQATAQVANRILLNL